MKRLIAWALAGLLPSIASIARAENSPRDAEIPVAPISASEFSGDTNTYQLRNAWISAVLAPGAGRVVNIQFDRQDNLLRLDAPLLARAPGTQATDDWKNYGGDWLWPVAQAHWKQMQDNDWPPPVLFRNAAWKGQAWESQGGAKYCLLGLELGEPLNIRIRRLVRVDVSAAHIDIRQRIERTAPSTIPVCLWNISQIAGAERVVLPTDDGYRVIAFTPPDSNITSSCETATVFDVARGGEHKVGSTSPRAWVAAQKGESLILEYATSDDAAGDHPDNGCRVEMYSNRGLGYTEIETLGAERNLAPGERTDNTLHIECYTVATNLTDCELAQKVRAWRGEVAAQPAQPAH